MTDFYAHSVNGAGDWHGLSTHLKAVAAKTRDFLEKNCLEDEGALAGLLHDIGKYGDLFQQRLLDPTRVTGLDHWSMGAWIALRHHQSLATAFAIQGHHIGLPSWDEMRGIFPEKLQEHHPLNLRLTESDPDSLLLRLKADGISPVAPQSRLITTKPGKTRKNIAEMLDVRRVFSALVDADFLDTEAHFQGDRQGKRYRRPGPALRAGESLDVLLARIRRLQGSSDSPEPVNQVRKELLQDCLQAARQKPGLFTLTAPTGSGKTLSMLAFALRHAKHHGLRRIVMVVPYLTLIEQTADIYRDLFRARFGADYVVEHHSMAGLGQEQVHDDSVGMGERRRRLLAENWDAPLIVTTSVQFLESLFSNRPSSCRKLHRLAEAVILFDEVQTLPVSLAVPTLAALSHLADRWGSTIVFSTATQPAFEHLDEAVKAYVPTGWKPTRIVPQPQQMTDRLRRVRYHFPKPGETLDWAALADAMSRHRQGLCVVNLKRHARHLHELLAENGAEGCYHLSTNLCPAHRRQVLGEIREKLRSKAPCRLVATQCVEAGVDVDFPRVWRAMGPLDAIIQAAGRCNRNGLMDQGEVTIFLPEDTPYPPMPGYLQATKVTESLLNRLGRDRFDPYDSGLIREYYRLLYQLSDPARQRGDLVEAIEGYDFPEVARCYRLIRQDTINIVVPWSGALSEYGQLRDLAEAEGLTRRWIRRARPLTVSLYRPKPEDVIWDSLAPVGRFRQDRQNSSREDWFIYLRGADYHDDLGLIPPDHLQLWIA